MKNFEGLFRAHAMDLYLSLAAVLGLAATALWNLP